MIVAKLRAETNIGVMSRSHQTIEPFRYKIDSHWDSNTITLATVSRILQPESTDDNPNNSNNTLFDLWFMLH